MTVFDSFAELEAHLMEELRSVIHNDIPPIVDDVIKEHINSDVYSYSPEWYDRRGMMKSGDNAQKDVNAKVIDVLHSKFG